MCSLARRRKGICRCAAGLAGCLSLFSANVAAAQAPADEAVPALTLTVQSRLVVEDVLVTDAKGRPVHGLPASAFHVYDQGKPQTIRSFEEGQAPAASGAALAARQPLPAGVFTNAIRGDAHTSSEVLLLDADSMELTDQMFLLQELRRSLASLPAGLEVAVFRVINGRPVQIRGFSTDREDLRRALGECLPVQTHVAGSRFGSAVEQLLAVTGLLEQTPGRKNLIWFAGQFPLVPVPGGEPATGPGGLNFSERERTIEQIHEALAEARIAVYPVDVRGVLNRDLAPPGVSSSAGVGLSRSPAASSGVTGARQVTAPEADGVSTERSEMRQLAQATGGKAYVLNNLSEEISEAFELGVRAYSVAYTPSPYATDDSWHTVRITVDGDYRLAYRPGYLATWTGLPGGRREGVRLEGGNALTGRSEPGKAPTQPIVFTVKVEPQRPAGKDRADAVGLRFRVPTEQLDFVRQDGRRTNRLLVSAYAYDGDGKVRGGRQQELDTTLSEAQWQQAQAGGQQVGAEQRIAVPKTARYLLMVVRDAHSRRVGSYFLSVRAVRALPTVMEAAEQGGGGGAPGPSAP